MRWKLDKDRSIRSLLASTAGTKYQAPVYQRWRARSEKISAQKSTEELADLAKERRFTSIFDIFLKFGDAFGLSQV